jgi:PAS domain S-box-containing protein
MAPSARASSRSGTQPRVAAEALEWSAPRWRALVDASPGCLLAAHADGTIHFCNRAFGEYIGVPHGEFDDDDVLAALPAADRAELVAAREHARSAGAFACELRLRRHDGALRWFLLQSAPERDEQGRIAGWITCATDVDELHRARDAKDDSLATASHELRTPLAAAKLQVQHALRALADVHRPTVGKALLLVARQIDRMSSLVDELLEASRIGAEGFALESSTFDLAALAREVAGLLEPLSPTHPITITAGETLLVRADRGRLGRVLTNLLSNAVRYSPGGGPIGLSLVADGEAVRVAVRDRGVGIPLEKQALIFERFGRAHGTRYGGLGLGLAITRQIVALHGGRMWVESSGVVGEGSVFFVQLPRG